MAILFPHYTLAKLLGASSYHSESKTVRELLEEIRGKLKPTDWEQNRRTSILINGRNIQFLDGLDTPLSPTDQVWLVLPSGGG